MGYSSLASCVKDLEKKGQLVRVKEEVDPYLEIAEIQRRLYEQQGPAVLFERVKGSPFPAVCNLFGTMDRCRIIFRDTLSRVKKIVALKADPTSFFKHPLSYLGTPFLAVKALPLPAVLRKPVLFQQTNLSLLPQVTSWPMDGGPYVTLPQVYSEDPLSGGVMNSNLGMYRIQMAGNEYLPDQEVGLHYQIHRGIGIHHTHAVQQGEPLKVSIFVGGPPAHTFSAVMPLPEGLTELMFAGLFGNRSFRYARKNGHLLSTDADFCIVGTIDPTATKPEGPFGDHLGYYSLTHPFPVMKVEAVYHRKDAIWPFTVVGRPPQEDTTFGNLIHEVTEPMVPVSIPGLHAMHAVDAAGVHPLLLAVGSERYVPYQKRQPQEILTIANAILGFGQASLAKYLLIIAKEDNPDIDIHHISNFLQHLLERVDWTRDLHFQTKTTIDTLDYSSKKLNEGSKVVIAAAGERRRELGKEWSPKGSLPPAWSKITTALPGILAIEGPAFQTQEQAQKEIGALAEALSREELNHFPLLLVVDDADFISRHLNNFLWATFTRSNPSHDIYGVNSFIEHKHWGCKGPLIIDARIKPHHAPSLVENPEVTKKVDLLAAKGGALHGII
ncbi:MAG: UbiD family decarboxylase [Bacteroidota bacterium]